MDELKRSAENRNKENADFNLAVQQQVAVQRTMANARQVLADEFSQEGASQLLQQKANQAGAMFAGIQQPAGFKEMDEKKSGGFAVLKILDEEIRASEMQVSDMRRQEARVQAKHEAATISLNNQAGQLRDSIAAKQNEAAVATENSVKNQNAFSKAQRNHMLLSKTHDMNKSQCKFLMDNFQTRQDRFTSEASACKAAIRALRGDENLESGV